MCQELWIDSIMVDVKMPQCGAFKEMVKESKSKQLEMLLDIIKDIPKFNGI